MKPEMETSGPIPTAEVLQQSARDAERAYRRSSKESISNNQSNNQSNNHTINQSLSQPISRRGSRTRKPTLSLEDTLTLKKLDWHFCSINQTIKPSNNPTNKQLPKLIFTLAAIDHIPLKNAKCQLVIDCLIDRSNLKSADGLIDDPHIRITSRQTITQSVRLVDLVAVDRSLSFEHPHLIQLVYRTLNQSKQSGVFARKPKHQRSQSSLTVTNEHSVNQSANHSPSPASANVTSTYQSNNQYTNHVLNLTLCSLRDVDDVSTILSAIVRLRQANLSINQSINQTIQSTQSVILPYNLLSGSVSGMVCLHQDIVELLDQSIYQSSKRVLQLFPNRLLVYRTVNHSIQQSINQSGPVYVFPLTLDNNESHVVVTNGPSSNLATGSADTSSIKSPSSKQSKIITLKMSDLTISSLDQRFSTLSFKCSSVEQTTKWLDAFELERSSSFKTPVSSLITDRLINQLIHQPTQDAHSPSQYHAPTDQSIKSIKLPSPVSPADLRTPSSSSSTHHSPSQAPSPMSKHAPITQSTNQSTNQSINQSINHSNINNTYNQSLNRDSGGKPTILQKGLMARSVSAPAVQTRPVFAFRLIDVRSEPPINQSDDPATQNLISSVPPIPIEPKADALLCLSLADSLRHHSHSRTPSNAQPNTPSIYNTAEGPFALPTAPVIHPSNSQSVNQPESLFSVSSLLRSQHAFFNYLHHLSIKPAINQSNKQSQRFTLADWRKKTPSSMFKKRSQTLQSIDTLIDEYSTINQSIHQCLSECRLFVSDVTDIASACQIGFAFIGFENQTFDVGRLSVVSVAQLLSIDPSNPCNFTVDDWCAALASLSPAKELMQCSPDIDQLFNSPDGVVHAKQLSYAAQRLVLHNCCLSAYIKVRMGNQTINQSTNQTIKSNEIVCWPQVLAVLDHLGSTSNQALLAEFTPVAYMINPRPQQLHVLLNELSKRSSSSPTNTSPNYLPPYAAPSPASQVSSPVSMRVTPLPPKPIKSERQQSSNNPVQPSKPKPSVQAETKRRSLFGGRRMSAAESGAEHDEFSTSVSTSQSPPRHSPQVLDRSPDDRISSFYLSVTGGDLRLLLNPLHLLVVLLEMLKIKQNKLNELAAVCLEWTNAHSGERGERMDAFTKLASNISLELDLINDAITALPSEDELHDEYQLQQLEEKARLDRGEQVKRRQIDLDKEAQLEAQRLRAIADLANFQLPVAKSRSSPSSTTPDHAVADEENEVKPRSRVESAMSLLEALRLDGPA